MATKKGLKAQAKRIASHGRNGDDRLAHLSADEIAILNSIQGGESINPDTGLPEYFSLKKVLKGAAKAAGALVGSYLGGPAGAAVGGGVVSALMGDSTQKALTTGLLSGLGAWGAQQSGLGDTLGISSLSSGADLLGREAASGAIQTASGSSGGGMGMSALLPILGIGAAAAAGGAKTPKVKTPKPEPEQQAVEYEPLERDPMAYGGDPYSYGVFGPEFQYFDEVNPNLQPVAAKSGGRIGFKYGGNVSEGGKKQGGSEKGGQGPNAGGSKGAGGDRGTLGQQQDRRNIEAARAAGNTAPGVKGPSGSGGNATIADKMIMDRYISTPAEKIPDEKSYWDAVKNLGPAYLDKQNYGNSIIDTLGNTLAGVFGVGEINPLSQPLGARVNNPDASWGVDPIGAALGIGGLAGAVPFGFGSIYQGIKGLTGYQGPMISFDGYNPISTEESASSYHWGQDGALSGLIGGGGNAGPAAGGGTGQGQIGQGVSQFAPAAPQPNAPGTQAANNQPPSQEGDQSIDDQTGRAYSPLLDPYSYGQFGPEHTFFTGELDMARGGTVRGPGDGQSDSIPAMLSNGEYVIDAETVSALGDGSTDAGAKKLDQMRTRIRKHKRSAKAHKIPPKTKGMSAYLKEAA